MRRFLILLAAVMAGTVLAAACGDDGGGSSTTDSEVTDSGVTDLDDSTGLDDTTGSAPVEEGSATLSLGDNGFVVDAEGFTVYLFDNDTGTASACTEGCASAWPPVTAAAEPVAGEGIDGALIGTAEQADGTVQVTYNGHLLYRYSGDTAAGDANGDGVGGIWHAVDADGNAAA